MATWRAGRAGGGGSQGAVLNFSLSRSVWLDNSALHLTTNQHHSAVVVVVAVVVAGVVVVVVVVGT